MKKSILLLGGSRQQVPVIEKSKELGLRTILMDYLPDNPGKDIADVWYPESTTDIEKVYEIAKKEDVIGILAYASDPAALPAAMACERLGLPTNSPDSVEILGVKHKFREFLNKNGFNCPQYFSFHSSETQDNIKKSIKHFRLPLVVKPTDSSGSKGVRFITALTQLEDALKEASKHSRNSILIIEEYIERGYPNVIGGDIFVVEGEIVFFGDMECIRGDNGKSLIPIGEIYPNRLNKNQKEVLYSELRRLIKSLNIKFGELNIEVLIDKENKPYFLEVGPRAGGNMIPIQLSDAFDIDLPLANIKAAIGEEVNLKSSIPNGCFITYVLHSKKEGIFNGVVISEEIKPYLYREVLYKKIGEKIENFDGAGKAIGIIFLKFPELNQINFNTEIIKSLVVPSIKHD